jgi:hypothetical protein
MKSADENVSPLTKPKLSQRLTSWAFLMIFLLTASLHFLLPHIGSVRRWGGKATWDSIYENTMYSRVVIFGNYFDDGFIRRGLGGTLAVALSGNSRLGIFLFVLFSVAFMVLPLAILASRLARSLSLASAAYLVAVVLVSPQTFVGWSGDLVRTDMLAGGFIAWSVLAALSSRRWLAVFLVLGGILAHEVAFIFGAPLLVAVFHEDVRTGTLGRRPALALVLGLVAGAVTIVGLQFAFSTPAAVLAANMVRAFPTAPKDQIWRDIAIYMAVGGKNAVATAMCHNFSLNPKWPITTALCMLILTAYALILPLWRKPVAVLLAMWIPVLFMLIIANDVGRWLKLGVLNAWLLTAFLALRSVASVRLTWPWMALGASTLGVLLMMGPTPHSDINYYTRHLIVRLGFEYKATPEQWLDTCDPGWRSIVYGPPFKSGKGCDSYLNQKRKNGHIDNGSFYKR